MKIKKLIGYILITFLIGGLFTPLTMDSSFYESLIKPFNIPAIVFPIVWSILYLLMAISYYLISESGNIKNKESITLYYVQLIVNSLWTLFFFGFKLLGFSSLWIVLLLVLVIFMVIKFYNINKTAAYLNIPYIIWLVLATLLNISIYYLN